VSGTLEAPAHPQRLHALDGLRGVAMLLGVVLHAAMVYLPANVPGATLDKESSVGLLALVGVIHSFRMQLFFVVAGFFAALICRRYGATGFLVHRTKRLMFPFLAAMVLIIPFVAALIPSRITERVQGQYVGTLPTGHLWFIQHLFLHCLVAFALIRWLPEEVRRRWGDALDRGFARLIAWRWKPAVLPLAGGLALWFSPHWVEIESPLPGITFLPTPRAVVYYGFYFVFGWLLHRQVDGLRWLEGPIWSKVITALVALPLVFVCFVPWLTLKDQAPSAWLLKVAGVWLHELVAWLWIFASFAFFLKYCAQSRPVLRYLADASYWIYLVHLPLVLWLQLLASKWDVNVWVKFGFVYGVAMALLIASYHLLVRRTFISVFLNGRRGGEPGPVTSPGAAAASPAPPGPAAY
jgi:glucan biosynthesis protein C